MGVRLTNFLLSSSKIFYCRRYVRLTNFLLSSSRYYHPEVSNVFWPTACSGVDNSVPSAIFSTT